MFVCLEFIELGGDFGKHPAFPPLVKNLYAGFLFIYLFCLFMIDWFIQAIIIYWKMYFRVPSQDWLNIILLDSTYCSSSKRLFN